jgi:serine/threonine protein kinase
MAVRTKSTSFAFSESELPVRFGRYLLLKRRNSDPVGEEFLAAWGVDEGVDQLRVVRCIYPSVAEEEHFVTYFSEEARALSRLLSANVVRVMEVDVESGIPFVACEHVEGLTLKRLIDLAKERKSPCTWELAVHIAGELLRGLDYVHRRQDVLGNPMGMRHGDVRPANVVISFDGEVKLTNFGSALYFIADDKTAARVQTYRGIYAPPEGSDVDEATIAGDLWGVSAVLSTLLGRGDLTSGSGPAANWDKAPAEELDTFLAKALNRNPEERFSAASSMREHLLGLMQLHAEGHPADDLSVWIQALGKVDRDLESLIVKNMLGRDIKMSLNETAERGKIGPGMILDGRYHLLRQLGEGGMGLVFEAEHLGIGRRVAIKVLLERVLDDETAVERFRREAQITGSLGHPNIVGVSDFGVTSEGYHYLVMDLLKGESLADRIEQGPLDPWELAGIMARVCDGLEAAHSAGVVHRDLKPENVILALGGPRILDFGIAKRTGLEEEEQPLTHTGFLCGTAEYLSPEQVRGMEPTPQSDIYAAGVIIYEALTLETPFRGRTIGETLHKVLSDKVVSPRKRSGNETIPKQIESICLKALQRDPKKRFKSAAEMAEALRAMAAEEKLADAGPQPASILPQKSKSYWIVLGLTLFLGALAVIVLAGFSMALWNKYHEEPVAIPPKEPGTAAVIEKKALLEESVEPVGAAAQAPKTPKEPERIIEKTEKPAERDSVDALGKRVDDLVARGDKELKDMRLGPANDLFQSALNIDPRAAGALWGLGRVMFEQGRYKEAADKVARAVELRPRRSTWRIFLGKIYRSLGRSEKARAEWNKVLKNDPDNEQAKKLLGD